MNDFASSGYCIDHVRSVLCVELFNRLIASYNKSLMLERERCTFCFSFAWVMVTPDFDIVTEDGVIVIVEKDSFLTSITVPPFVLAFEIDVGSIFVSCVFGLTYSRLSIDPHSSNGGGGSGGISGKFVSIDVFLSIEVFRNIDDSSFNGLFRTDFYEFLVTSSFVSFLVESSRFDSERPWSVDSGIFFVAVIICTVINFDYLCMNLLVMLGEMGKSNFVREVEEELEMYSTFLSFFKLSGDEVALVYILPFAEVFLAGSSIRVVLSD